MENVKMSNINYYDSSFVNAEDVMLSEDKTVITILNTSEFYNYTLFNSKTGMQTENWMSGSKGTVVFSGLDPKIEYAVRVQSREDILPMPVVKPEIIINPTIPVLDADIIIPAKKPTFNPQNGCGMISIKADSNYGYAILNDKNMPLTDKQLKEWGIKVTNSKGFLVPKTDDGYFFTTNTIINFEVPAGGEYKMGGKNLSKKYTFINGPTFITPGVYYNAWYGYVPPYFVTQKGSYNLIIIPACRYSNYSLFNKAGQHILTQTDKDLDRVVTFKHVNPSDSVIVGSPIPLKE